MQIKLVEDILNSTASLGANASLRAFAQMLAGLEEYRLYSSVKDEDAKTLAERYINNDAWVMFDDIKFRTFDPIDVAHYGTEGGDIHGIIYGNGGVWLISQTDTVDMTLMLFILRETADEEGYPEPS